VAANLSQPPFSGFELNKELFAGEKHPSLGWVLVRGVAFSFISDF